MRHTTLVRLPTLPFPIPAGLYYGWVIVGVAFASNLLLAPMTPVVFAFFMAPMSEDLGWSRSAIALAFTIRLVAGGLSGPIIGAWLDRYGARWLGTLASIMVGVLLLAIPFARELWLFYVIFAIAGSMGFGGPGGNLLTMVPIANWFVAKRGRALAISIIGLPLGVTIGVPLAEWMIQTIGWRAAWVLFGVSICLVGAPIYSIFMRKDPSSLGLAPDGLPRAEDKTHPSSTPSAIATQDDWTLRQAMRTITFWLLIGNAALSGVALTATLLYRVSFWQSKGMSPTLVAIGTAADPFTVMFSALAFGILAERVPIRYMGVLGFLGFGLSMLPMMLNSGEAWAIFAHNITWGLAAGAAITANNLVWPNYFGTKFLGTIRGMTLPVSVAAGGIGPPLYGFLLDSGVFPPLVFSLSFALLVGAALLFLLARPPVMGQRSHPQN